MQAMLERYGLSRQRAALQLEGWAYALADFTVRLGRAVQAPQQQFLGLVLDVAYEPLSHSGADAAAVLQVGGHPVQVFARWALLWLPRLHGHGCRLSCVILSSAASALYTSWVQDFADIMVEAVAAAGGVLRRHTHSAATGQQQQQQLQQQFDSGCASLFTHRHRAELYATLSAELAL